MWLRGVVLDHETRKQKQQALMTELIERKIRLHAQHLYEKRGEGDGSALQDWIEAESQVLENSILGPLYRRSRVNSLTKVDLTEEMGDSHSRVSPPDPSCS